MALLVPNQAAEQAADSSMAERCASNCMPTHNMPLLHSGYVALEPRLQCSAAWPYSCALRISIATLVPPTHAGAWKLKNLRETTSGA